MPNLNKVMLMGNLTRDPEVRYLPSKSAVCNFGLAINRKWKDAGGESREEVVFVDCEAFAKQAELIAQYLKKGRPVFVEGRLKLDQWEKDGVRHQKMRVVVETFQFIDSRESGDVQAATPKPAQRQQYTPGSVADKMHRAVQPKLPVADPSQDLGPAAEDAVPF